MVAPISISIHLFGWYRVPNSFHHRCTYFSPLMLPDPAMQNSWRPPRNRVDRGRFRNCNGGVEGWSLWVAKCRRYHAIIMRFLALVQVRYESHESMHLGDAGARSHRCFVSCKFPFGLETSRKIRTYRALTLDGIGFRCRVKSWSTSTMHRCHTDY